MKKESMTRTKVQEQAIVDFIQRRGYKNVAEFAKAVNMDRQIVWARIKGKTDPDVRMLLRWSVALACDINRLIELFYPTEYADYNHVRSIYV